MLGTLHDAFYGPERHRVRLAVLSNQFIGNSVIVTEQRSEQGETVRAPTCMDDADVLKVKVDGKALEPLDGIAVTIRAEWKLAQEGGVLLGVLVSVWPDVVGAAARSIANRVEFVIAEDSVCRTAVNHGANQIECPGLLRTSIDKVAEKDGLPARVTIGAVSLLVIQLLQQRLQLIRAAMDVADDIERRVHRSCCQWGHPCVFD